MVCVYARGGQPVLVYSLSIALAIDRIQTKKNVTAMSKPTIDRANSMPRGGLGGPSSPKSYNPQRAQNGP